MPSPSFRSSWPIVATILGLSLGIAGGAYAKKLAKAKVAKPLPAVRLFVDRAHGDDRHRCTQHEPCATPKRARELVDPARETRILDNGSRQVVICRPGSDCE